MSKVPASTRPGTPPKYPGIIYKAKAVDTPGKLDNLIRRYLADDTKLCYVSPAKAAQTLGNLTYEEAVAKDLAPQRPGLEFWPEVGPKVRVFGHVRDILRRSIPDIDEAPPKRVIPVLSRWWFARTINYVKKASHLVFSLDPKVSKRAYALGLPDGEALFKCAKYAIDSHSKRFYSGESLGWAGGNHRDRAQTHLHTLVLPWTATGRTINLSPLSSVTVKGTRYGAHRIDYQGALKSSFAEACEIYSALIFNVPIPVSLDVQDAINPLIQPGSKKPFGEMGDTELQAAFDRRFDSILAANLNRLEPFSLDKDANRLFFPRKRRPFYFKEQEIDTAKPSNQPPKPAFELPKFAPAQLAPSKWRPPPKPETEMEIG